MFLFMGELDPRGWEGLGGAGKAMMLESRKVAVLGGYLLCIPGRLFKENLPSQCLHPREGVLHSLTTAVFPEALVSRAFKRNLASFLPGGRRDLIPRQTQVTHD